MHQCLSIRGSYYIFYSLVDFENETRHEQLFFVDRLPHELIHRLILFVWGFFRSDACSNLVFFQPKFAEFHFSQHFFSSHWFKSSKLNHRCWCKSSHVDVFHYRNVCFFFLPKPFHEASAREIWQWNKCKFILLNSKSIIKVK